ncbi:tail length tape measure protein [Erwinia phage ENT90]|uniref:Phage tail measure protein n=2 Tax=root TaxID=1 RepID=F1BUT7_9CAUD|nr:tail length tape measure protein [Erwinia phage ENT90]ADX32408.1 phage tail measure protein [Erwinia phage ENT90]ORM61798.1 phage tail tape measure protein [Mixta calida]
MSNNLKLQVLLKAVDQATRPFKAVQAASKTLAGDIRGSQDELKALNAQAHRIESFRNVSAQLAVTGEALKKAKAEAAALGVQMRSSASPTAAQVKAFENARRSAAAMQEKYNSLRQSVQRQRAELQQSGIDTRNLSAAGRTLRNSIAETTATINRQREALARVSQQQERLNAISQRYERGKNAAAGVRNVSAASLGAGTAALYAGSRLMAPEIQSQQSGAMIAARQGEDAEKGRQYTAAIQRINASGVSGDIAEITEAVSAVRSTLGTLGDVGEAELDRITRKALDMQTTFGTDTAESIQIAAIMMKNNLAGSSDEAMDLIVSGMQRVSTEMRGELPEILHEYSTHFRNMGFTGAEAMSLLVDMSKQGKFALDKTGDAIKEFSIRGSDMSKNSVAAYKQIGLNAEKMSRDIATGGDKARAAMQKTAKGLLAIKDPAERANAAITLFGTPVEDLSVDQIPAFLGALAGVKNQLGDVSGAAGNMGKTLRDNLSGDVAKLQGAFSGLRFNVFTRMDGHLRTLTQSATGWLTQLNAWIKANPALTSNLVLAAGAVAGLAAVLGGVGLVVWPVMAGINALIAGAGLLSAGFTIAGGAITAALGAITLPVVAVVAAIVAGALIIRKYWEPISAFISGVAEGFTAAMGPISEAFAPLKPVFDWFTGKVKSLWGWFGRLLEPVKSTQAELASAGDMGKKFGTMLADALKFPSDMLNQLKGGIDWVLEKLGVIDKKSSGLKDKVPEHDAVATGGAGISTGDLQYNLATGGAPYKPVTAPAARGATQQNTYNSNYVLNMHEGMTKDDALALMAQNSAREQNRAKAQQRSRMGWED